MSETSNRANRKERNMRYFKLKYRDGTIETVAAPDALTLIQQRDLYTRAHIDTRIFELSGEQAAIAATNEHES